MDTLKKYLLPIVTLLIAFFFNAFKRRGDEIDKLNNQLATTKVNDDLKQLTKEYDDVHAETVKTGNDYDNLIHANSELASKLGIGPNSDRDKANN